mmetsp:Transcript_55045/g.61505  ORF Transcript_55045/g.61505 Transcript_55045/m.61505 type:complete len:318 (+) Transcript_55045:35-988(+)
MGGDGGVIASSRRFMRGAGTADLTADFKRHAAEKFKFNAREAMTTCSLTKTPLYITGTKTNTNTNEIVSDLHGHLYHKEAAVQALLKRRQQQRSDAAVGTIGPQVRRLNDLYDVRFFREQNDGNKSNCGDNTPSCPITGKALTGNIPSILLVVSGKSDGSPNVVSESALKQLSPEELQEEYGCIERKVRLAPPPLLLESIKDQVRKEHEKDEEERKAKKAGKKKNKRKRDGRDNKNKKRSSDSNSKKATEEIKSTGSKNIIGSNVMPTSSPSSVGQEVQSRVNSAIQQNVILSSLFTNKTSSSKISEKEKKDNLFAR